MNSKLCNIAILLAATISASGQTRPTFEVASIKRIVDYVPTATMNGDISHGRISLTNAHLTQLISVAYEIQSVRIQGVPGSLSSDQYQVSAKAEDPEPSEAQTRVMLQDLLADRFRLKFHWEDKPLPNFTLHTATGGPKLERAQEDGVDSCNRTVDGSKYDLTCRHIQIGTLANALAIMLHSPVVDDAGLTDHYDFTLTWEGDDMFSAVPDALERFGLKLEMKKVPTRVFVIDSVERPSEN
jgi:uncharacterized protein (TIGR03435 family)